MPKFIDYHEKAPALSPEMVGQMVAAMKAGKPNELGVTPINFFMSTGGQGYCLSEAPNAEAVRQMHAALGVPISAKDVVEVQSLV